MNSSEEGLTAPPRADEVSTERTLIACSRCQRQYDVSGLSHGDRVRCACSAVLVVEPRRAHVPRALCCGRCGAALVAAHNRCEYCAAEITLAERRLSGVCPGCYARLSSDARFCMECGIAIAPEAPRAVRIGSACPRCAGGLQARSVGTLELVECRSCAGLWIDPAVFAAICDETEKQELARRHIASEAPGAPVATTRGRAYLACVTCGDFMVPRNFGGGSGVLIDVCKQHGVWLDHDELARLLDFVRAGGLMRAREREVVRMESRAARARDHSSPMPAAFELDEGSARATPDLEDALRWIGARLGGWLGK